MRTYSGSNAGSKISPLINNAQESIWITSPWIGKEYATQLAFLSHKGIEVRIITSNVDYNLESLEILKASENPNLILLVLDRNSPDQNSTFVHAKIYIIDKKFAVSGSANLTFSGLNANVESLSIAESKDEVQQIENDFMRIWMTYERKGRSIEQLSSGTSYSIRKALPLSVTYENTEKSTVKKMVLVFHPYYFFGYTHRGWVRSPPLQFEDSGFVILNAASGQIISNDLLESEIRNKAPAKTDFVLNTEDKYQIEIIKTVVGDFREATELALDYIIKVNTRKYLQDYRNASYERLYVPHRNSIRLLKSDFVYVPIWHIEVHEPSGMKHEDIVFGASGRKWNQLIFCPECNKKIWIDQVTICEKCGKKICGSCVCETGIIFRKKLCPSCSITGR